jgi:lysophospholipase L1-like esterase
MAISLMVPPDDGSRSTISFHGRTYTSVSGAPVEVLKFDVPLLEANGWRLQLAPAGMAANVGSETIYGKLKRLARVARFDNPHLMPAMTSPPDISGSTTAPGALSKAYRYQTNPTPFAFYGGNVVPYFTTFSRAWCVSRFGTGAGNVLSDPPRDGVAWRCEFMADASVICFAVNNNATTPFRFLVDGRYVSLTATMPPGGTSTYYISLDFSAAGGRKIRRIVLEGELASAFLEARVGPTDSIYAVPNADRLRMVIGGDSFTAGVGASRIADGWAFVLADCLGIKDMWASGSGGTGYLNNVGGTKFSLRERISDVIDPHPDIVGLAMGINDNASSVASVQAEVGLLLDAIRASMPMIPIFVFGVFKGNIALATIQALENGLQAVVQTRMSGDPNLFFVPVTGTGSSTDNPWVFGTGRTGAPTGDGNSDLYTGGANGADVTHPSPAGHFHLGYRAADAMIAAIANKL